MSDVQVSDRPDQGHYEVTVDGQRTGIAEYKIRGEVITFTHTEVDDAYEGRGLAGRLARYALDDARARGLRVRPVCPYIRRWIQRHEDYQDLVV